ncbi:hypothetical protein [Aquipseudomonas alcaligenes]|uniref:hypothetical protein n=1 Tax=Aquipseudomonas alcaligenes TaxID=43263 RepID=UPI000A8427C5|nr:hypothetical protein [Pseudomonas alcaligenes]
MNNLPILNLPKRFEALERQATAQQYDLSSVVQRIDNAAARLETLLRQVQFGGLGRFELFLGKSGAGKTTFFKTLTKFFSGTEIHEIPADIPLNEISEYISKRHVISEKRHVWVMHDRDNQIVQESEAFEFLETLRVLFRKPEGAIVLCWPLTDENTASLISEKAWDVGRDSVVDISTKGLYIFQGPPKDTYLKIAELTTRSLKGDGLEAFGVTETLSTPLIQESETIAEFYSRLEAKAAEITGRYKDLLKDKPIPSVWILVGGDDSRELNLTVASLTQGIGKAIDIDRITNFLDNPSLDAAYLKEWKKRRQQVAFLMRLLDVRLFELPPNVALAAVRAFGDDEVKSPLTLKKISNTVAGETLGRAPFFRALCGEDIGQTGYLRATEQETKNEYIRIQVNAKSGDKKLNKCLADAVRFALETKKTIATVTAEKQNDHDNLKPDVLVRFDDGKIVCLEPTWRSTGTEIPGEIKERQNTLTIGHIQMYVLEKVLGYVNELGF